jgi:hypothetical protein
VKGAATLDNKVDSRQWTTSQQQAGSIVLTAERQNWYRRMLCRLGLHVGGWNYLAEDKCGQMRVCAKCGKASQRTRHLRHREYIRQGACGQRKICRRCDEIAGHRTRHEWGPTYSLGGSENGHQCERCNLEQSWTVTG